MGTMATAVSCGWKASYMDILHKAAQASCTHVTDVRDRIPDKIGTALESAILTQFACWDTIDREEGGKRKNGERERGERNGE